MAGTGPSHLTHLISYEPAKSKVPAPPSGREAITISPRIFNADTYTMNHGHSSRSPQGTEAPQRHTAHDEPCQRTQHTVTLTINGGQPMTFPTRRTPYGTPINPRNITGSLSAMERPRTPPTRNDTTADGEDSPPCDARIRNYTSTPEEDAMNEPPYEFLQFLLLHCELSDIQRRFPHLSESELKITRRMALAKRDFALNWVEQTERHIANWVRRKREKRGLSLPPTDPIIEIWLRQYPGPYKLQLDGTFADWNNRPVPRELYPYLTKLHRHSLPRTEIECPSHSDGYSDDDSSLSDFSENGERIRERQINEPAQTPPSDKWTAISNETVEDFFLLGYAPSRRRSSTLIVPPTYYVPHRNILDRTLRETLAQLEPVPRNNQLSFLPSCIPMFCTTNPNTEHIANTGRFTCPWSTRLQPWHKGLQLSRHFDPCKGRSMTLDELINHLKDTDDVPHRCAAVFLEKLYKENTYRLDPDDVQTDAGASSSESSMDIF